MNLRPSGYEPDELPTAPPRDDCRDTPLAPKTFFEGKEYPYNFFNRQRLTLPQRLHCSTISVPRLNLRVRYGNGCDPGAIATGLKMSDVGSRRSETLCIRHSYLSSSSIHIHPEGDCTTYCQIFGSRSLTSDLSPLTSIQVKPSTN